MKPNKKLAGLTAAALAASGVAVIALASPALASSQTFQLYSGINNTLAQGVQNAGLHNLNLTVSPAAPVVGAGITVTLTSSNLNFPNGPVANLTANAEELDAVISINNVDYALRGPQNNTPVDAGSGNNIFDAGWVISSTAGSSSGNTPANGVNPAAAATTGVGTAVRSATNSVIAPLVAPNTPGTYTIGLKALVINSIAGTSTAGFSDQFDNIYNTDSVSPGGTNGAPNAGSANGSFFQNVAGSPNNGLNAGLGNIIFTTPVTIGVTGPSATIVSSSNQISGVTNYVRPGTGVSATLTGNSWPISQPVGSFTAQFCDTPGTTCDPVQTNTLSTDISGNLSGTFSMPTAANTVSGLRSIKLTNGASFSLTAVTALAARTMTITPAAGGTGTVVAISGANWNPLSFAVKFAAINNTGSYGLVNGTNGGCTGFATPLPACTAVGPYIPGPTNAIGSLSADASGNISASVTVADGATTQIEVAEKSITAGAPTNVLLDLSSLSQGGSKAVAFAVNQDSCTADTGNVNTGNCNTKQNVLATVLAGNLSQQAAAAPGNPNDTTVVFCKTAAPVTDPGGTQDGNTTACGLSSPIAATPMFGTLNPVTVTDTRGGNFGWSLTATMPALTDGTHSIANGQLAITPACASVNAGSAPGAVAGAAAQTFAGTVSLCVKDTQIAVSPGSQTTGGQWTISAPLTLTVPAFQAAGQYNSTITINLA